MSDDSVGRYRRAYPRIWRHQGFLALTPNAQRVALYILLGPQMNRIGLSHFSVATAAEDVNLGMDTFRKGLSDVCLTFGWVFDSEARVIYIPSWWRWNRPDNVNVLRGNLKDISELPPCGLVEAFSRNLTYVPLDLHETFIETLRQRLPERPPTQEQEQGSITRERTRTRARMAGEGNEDGSTGQPVLQTPDRLMMVARETLKLTNPNRPLEELVDAFLNIYRGTNAGAPGHRVCSVSEARQALNQALSEQRMGIAV